MYMIHLVNKLLLFDRCIYLLIYKLDNIFKNYFHEKLINKWIQVRV